MCNVYFILILGGHTYWWLKRFLLTYFLKHTTHKRSSPHPLQVHKTHEITKELKMNRNMFATDHCKTFWINHINSWIDGWLRVERKQLHYILMTWNNNLKSRIFIYAFETCSVTMYIVEINVIIKFFDFGFFSWLALNGSRNNNIQIHIHSKKNNQAKYKNKM